MLTVAPATVAIVEHRHDAMHVECYAHRLDAVFGMLNQGTLGTGGVHGGDEHVAALRAVIFQAQTIIGRIQAQRALEEQDPT